MVKLIFVGHDGSEYSVEVAEGATVLRAALDNHVPGMTGECGGELSCGTCHCYLNDGLRAAIPAPGTFETEMLECLLDVTEQSRLGCQLVVSAHYEGARIRLPG